MPQPTSSAVHVDTPLTNISVAYLQDPGLYVATKVFPIVPVPKKTDLYFTYTKNDFLRDEAKERADATESAGSGYGLSTTQYSCKVYAMHKDVGDQTRANADNPLDMDRDATLFVTQRLLTRLEVQWAGDFMKTNLWGTDMTGVASAGSVDSSHFLQWNDPTSDPIGDIETGKRTILINTGFPANTLVLGYDVFRQLKNHPDIVDRYKYTTSSVITEEMLARLFDVERVVVAKAVYATNVEGETAAYSFTVGKSALLCHTAPNPGLLTPSAGYVFMWQGVSGGLGQNVGIRRFRMEWLTADRIEGQMAFADQAVSTDLGYFYTTAVA